jgi:hypothetical protein
MLVKQKVLDTLPAETYTCVVSSHSHSHSPRQYLDETVETKRAPIAIQPFPSANRPGVQVSIDACVIEGGPCLLA